MGCSLRFWSLLDQQLVENPILSTLFIINHKLVEILINTKSMSGPKLDSISKTFKAPCRDPSSLQFINLIYFCQHKLHHQLIQSNTPQLRRFCPSDVFIGIDANWSGLNSLQFVDSSICQVRGFHSQLLTVFLTEPGTLKF